MSVSSIRHFSRYALHFFRAIGLAWIVIITSAIPAAVSHGVLKYPYAGYNYTACVFLRDLGYNHIAFQVINE